MQYKKSKASLIVDKMLSNDPYSQWLGIERVEDGEGISRLRLNVTEQMLNGFSIAHGGIAYALADSALAFASNGHGIQSVSIETSISHTRPVNLGDVLIATAKELSLTERFGIYEVMVTNQEKKTVAIFKGTVFRTGKPWIV
jgi:acyl-CoA thioesterase